MKKRKKVLVVDDEPDFLKIIRKRLETSHYEVITAASGKEALDKIKKDKPDAVFLDILMPELDGLETLKKIRRKAKDLPVFIITAFSNEERFKLAKHLKASGFVIKTSNLKREIESITGALRISGRYKGRRSNRQKTKDEKQ
ncbi:MAG: response regulator [Candidatus Ratteibacteria bacterium]|nr:response regulator [Candidatus Ratteibacteria bacterium]